MVSKCHGRCSIACNVLSPCDMVHIVMKSTSQGALVNPLLYAASLVTRSLTDWKAATMELSWIFSLVPEANLCLEELHYEAITTMLNIFIVIKKQTDNLNYSI